MMTDFLKRICILTWNSDELNISENTRASLPVEALRTLPEMPSGPAAFRMFTLLTSCSEKVGLSLLC